MVLGARTEGPDACCPLHLLFRKRVPLFFFPFLLLYIHYNRPVHDYVSMLELGTHLTGINVKVGTCPSSAPASSWTSDIAYRGLACLYVRWERREDEGPAPDMADSAHNPITGDLPSALISLRLTLHCARVKQSELCHRQWQESSQESKSIVVHAVTSFCIGPVYTKRGEIFLIKSICRAASFYNERLRSGIHLSGLRWCDLIVGHIAIIRYITTTGYNDASSNYIHSISALTVINEPCHINPYSCHPRLTTSKFGPRCR